MKKINEKNELNKDNHDSLERKGVRKTWYVFLTSLAIYYIFLLLFGLYLIGLLNPLNNYLVLTFFPNVSTETFFSITSIITIFIPILFFYFIFSLFAYKISGEKKYFWRIGIWYLINLILFWFVSIPFFVAHLVSLSLVYRAYKNKLASFDNGAKVKTKT